MTRAQSRKTSGRERKLPLREMQRLMASAILNPLTDDQETSARRADGTSMTEIAESIIKPNDRLTSFERLAIYNRQYWFRLIDCMYDDFPGLRAVVGDAKYYDLTIAYLTKYPSASYSLRDLGSRLVQFLTEEPKWLGSRVRAGLDMARFEWAQVVAFDGPALPPVGPEIAAGTDPSRMKLHLQPYMTLLELRYPFDELVIALRKEQQVQRSEAGAARTHDAPLQAKVKLPKSSTIYLAVHRFRNSLFYKRLDKPAFVLLSMLADGKSLAQACDAAGALFPKSALLDGTVSKTLQEWFSIWTSLGWFCVPQPSEDNDD